MALSGRGADHTTIAKFIVRNSERIKGLFAEVLLYCNELGLIGGDMFAVDGCRLPSNASKEWSGTREKLKAKQKKFEEHAAKLLAAHRESDKSEDEDEESDRALQEESGVYRPVSRIDERARLSTWRVGERGTVECNG
jgi:hypothetical protein